jgi:hypothetical protein
MMPLALVAAFALAAANEADGGEPAPQVELTQPADPLPEVEPAMQAPAGPGPELWEGEHRRVHFGLGIRVHGGLMASAGYPLWMLQSELLVMLSIRLRGHDELRIQISYGTGYPDLLGGESNVSFHHSFSRRVSLGVGVFAYLSVWSMRLGVEAPLIIRIGTSRRHLLVIALRAHSGTFSNLPILQWTLASQRFAIGGDLAVGYAFQF